MKCKVCDKNFTPKMKTHLYCSAYCREKRKRLEYPNDQKVEYQKKYRTSDRGRYIYRSYHLKYKYGITVEQYEEVLKEQGGCCAICGRLPETEKRSLAVDHDHHTGEIFGILCWWCNHKLVGKNRNPSLFAKAATYLTKGTGLFVPPDMVNPKKKRRKK